MINRDRRNTFHETFLQQIVDIIKQTNFNIHAPRLAFGSISGVVDVIDSFFQRKRFKKKQSACFSRVKSLYRQRQT